MLTSPLRLLPKRSLTLLNTKVEVCHEESSSNTYLLLFTILGALILSVGASAQNPPRTATVPPPPAIPPKSIPIGEWNVRSDTSDSDGTVHKWHGHPVEMEDSRMLFRADDIEYDEGTGDVRARGHVYFRDFDRNLQIWADHLEYNTQE